MALTFLTESTKDFKETSTIGGFNRGVNTNGFDNIFVETYNNLLNNGVDAMVDINELVKNKAKMAAFKESLLGELATECENLDPEIAGTQKYLYEQVSDMFDNCVEDFVKESTKVGTLLPIKAIDFPILVKQHLKLAAKDIIQTEVTKSPVIKKHIEQTYIVDGNDPTKRWKYPQCFFNDDFKEIYAAGKGIKLSNETVSLPVYNYNVITGLTDKEKAGLTDHITIDLKIPEVVVTVKVDESTTKTTTVKLREPMRINLSDNTWLGGTVKTTVTVDDVEYVVDDMVTGTVDFVTNTVSLTSFKSQIADATAYVSGVKFAGYLSNEDNLRSTTFDYSREEREWKIDDGHRVNVPYSLEELEDAKALMDIDLYQKTYNNLTDYLVQMEDSQILTWLDEQFEAYKGVEISASDMLDWSGFIYDTTFSCDSTSITTALPSEYIEKMLKFKIDGIITDIADNAKLEDMTFVIYGNPRLIRFLNPVVNWVTRPGSTRNGVKLDYGYGLMTSGDVKVQVVSTKKVNVKYNFEKGAYSGLRIIPFPMSNEQFTFKHYKYTTHILTAQNSAYRDPNRPGGSYNNLMGTSRYTNAVVQGIQGNIDIADADKYIQLGVG